MKEKKRIIELTEKSKKLLLAVGAVIGIILLIFGGTGKVGTSKQKEAVYSLDYYTKELEARIESLCTSVGGIEYAKVLLTLDNGSEYVYAQNEKNSGSQSGSAKDYVIISDSKTDSPILVNEIYPKIRGVAVVCTGGDRADVQRTVTELLTAALGLQSNKIKVAGG